MQPAPLVRGADGRGAGDAGHGAAAPGARRLREIPPRSSDEAAPRCSSRGTHHETRGDGDARVRWVARGPGDVEGDRVGVLPERPRASPDPAARETFRGEPM